MANGRRDFQEEGDGRPARSGRQGIPPQAHTMTPDGTTQEGEIKRLIMDKGFGFILGENGKEYFFHRTVVEGDFADYQAGMRVRFLPMRSEKGPRADQVRLL